MGDGIFKKAGEFIADAAEDVADAIGDAGESLMDVFTPDGGSARHTRRLVMLLDTVVPEEGGWKGLHFAIGRRYGIVWKTLDSHLELQARVRKGLNYERVRPKRVKQGMEGFLVEAGESILSAQAGARFLTLQQPQNLTQVELGRSAPFTYWVVTGNDLKDYDW